MQQTITKRRHRGALILADGRVFKGKLGGKLKSTGRFGEVFFTTAMSGYQETITDPACLGKFICFTYPAIGNCGINDVDSQSPRPSIQGIIVRDYNEIPSNFQSTLTLEQYLTQYDLPILTDVDTRALTRHIRKHGIPFAGISPLPDNEEDDTVFIEKYLTKLKANSSKKEQPIQTYDDTHLNDFVKSWMAKHSGNSSKMKKIAVLNFGIKFAILEKLLERDMLPVIFDANRKLSEQDFAMSSYSGFLFSSGPGNPSDLKDGLENVSDLIKTGKPCFAIGLGHQVLSLALGAQVHQMRFGHHGAGQPVKANDRKALLITSQGHDIVVDEDSLVSAQPLVKNYLETNANDDSLEGFRLINKSTKIISVQYNPEANAGPRDAVVLFDEFKSLVDG